MLKDLYLEEFVSQALSSDPVPGGGSVAALSSALSAALAGMVANLTVGKKIYIEVSDEMEEIALKLTAYKDEFMLLIDEDASSFDGVIKALRLPKETEEEKKIRRKKIQEETKYASKIPLSIARKTSELFDLIERVVVSGNKNAVTDGLVAAMMARTSILSALYNVKINLASIKDEAFVKDMRLQVQELEDLAIKREKEILELSSL